MKLFPLLRVRAARVFLAAFSCVGLLFLGGCVSPREGGIISWRQAPQHVGQRMTIEGVVVATHQAERASFLNFSEDWKRDCTVIIYPRDYPRWPDVHPVQLYKGKRIRVTGTVRRYKERVEIICASPKQIEIVR